MSDLLKEMREYFKNTSQEQIEADWKKYEKWEEVGITVDDLLKSKIMQNKDFYCASNNLEKIKCKFQCFDCKGYEERPKLKDDEMEDCAGCGKLVPKSFFVPTLCWECYSNKF